MSTPPRPPIQRRPLPPSAATRTGFPGPGPAQGQAGTGSHRPFSEVSDYREMPTLIADPSVFHGISEERTPVTELKTPIQPRRQKLSMPYLVIAGVLLLGTGLVAYRNVTRAARLDTTQARERVVVGKSATGASSKSAAEALDAAKKVESTAAAQPATPPAPDAAEPGFESATPALAARSFALGEYERALEQYRFLAHQNPDAEVYAVMVKVLTARTKER
jgi:hypothetical protein